MIFTCRGILFDLDGVLVDSTAAVARVWQHWAEKHGLSPEEVIREAHGRRSIETIRLLAPHLDADRENEIVEHMEICDLEGVVALPGAIELLRSLPATQFAIVTSGTRPLATARLSHAGIPVPKQLVSADDVQDGKPSPEPYLKGAALLHLAAHDCLVFEDTPAGIESARRAGIRSIALSTTFEKSELLAADAIIPFLAEVRARVEQGNINLELNE